jgi:hypothetical protein
MGGVSLMWMSPKMFENVSEIPVLILEHCSKPHVMYSREREKKIYNHCNFHDNRAISNNVKLKEFSMNLAPT